MHVHTRNNTLPQIQRLVQVDLRSTGVCADAGAEAIPGPASFTPRTLTLYSVPLFRLLKVTMVVCTPGVVALFTDTPTRKSSTNQLSGESVPVSAGGGCRGIASLPILLLLITQHGTPHCV